MKIIKGWLFCNRRVNNGTTVPTAFQLDHFVEILDHNGHIGLLYAYDDSGICMTDVDTAEFMLEFEKYLKTL